MSTLGADIPTYYSINSETVVDSGWTVKEFLVPQEGIIKRVRAGVEQGAATFDLAFATSNVFSTKNIFLMYSNIDTEVMFLDSKENLYYKVPLPTETPTDPDQNFVYTSTGKAIYLKYFSKLKEFYKVYSSFTSQDHQEAVSIINQIISLKRAQASLSKINGKISEYNEYKEEAVSLEKIAEQHQTAASRGTTVQENNFSNKTLLPIYIWLNVKSGNKKIWYQLDIENVNNDNVCSVEGSSSKYRTVPENPICCASSNGEVVHEISLGTLARIDLTPRLDGTTTTFTLQEKIYGDVVMLSLNGQLLGMNMDFTFDKETNSVSLIEAPETTDVVILHYINQPIYNL
jgi:hypothetical protein